MTDKAHQDTDKMLEKLESRIDWEYRIAVREMKKKAKAFLERFQEDDKKHKALVDQGLLSQSDYDKWRLSKMTTGKWYENMRDTLAEDLSNTREIARKLTGEHMKDVYALNHNWAAYQMEHDTEFDLSFSLYDHATVERLLKDKPDILPQPGKKVAKDIAEGKAKRWSKRQMQSVMTQSILQGESIPKIAERLTKTVGEMDKSAAIRNARTMTTTAESAGRVDSYKHAQDMGIDLKQIWLATLDGRTRHAHRLLDGQMQPVGKPFEVDGEKIEYPGDLSAPGYLIYNCRCRLIAAVKGTALENGINGLERNSKLGEMSYDEWKNALKKPEGLAVEKPYGIEQLRQAAEKSTDKYDFWTSLDENQQAIFKASGMKLDDVFNLLHRNAESSEWKEASPGGPESFAFKYDFSNEHIKFKKVKARSDGWMADANIDGVVNVREDGLGNDWEFVISHEMGHQISNLIPGLGETILENPGNIFGRYNTRLMAFDGVYGEYNPEEAFATCISNYIRHPDNMKQKYPDVYKALDILFENSPSARIYVEDAMNQYRKEFIK